MSRPQIVTESQLNTIDKFVVALLKQYKEGKIELEDAKLDLGHVIVAIDKGSEAEYTSWVAQWLKDHQ